MSTDYRPMWQDLGLDLEFGNGRRSGFQDDHQVLFPARTNADAIDARFALERELWP